MEWNITEISMREEYFSERITTDSIKETNIGPGLSEFMLVVVVGYEGVEARSPLAFDNG